jgi:hypothetical protein
MILSHRIYTFNPTPSKPSLLVFLAIEVLRRGSPTFTPHQVGRNPPWPRVHRPIFLLSGSLCPALPHHLSCTKQSKAQPVGGTQARPSNKATSAQARKSSCSSSWPYFANYFRSSSIWWLQVVAWIAQPALISTACVQHTVTLALNQTSLPIRRFARSLAVQA